MEQIDGLNEGAFAPWWNQPVVKAVLLSLLTYGGIHACALLCFAGKLIELPTRGFSSDKVQFPIASR